MNAHIEIQIDGLVFEEVQMLKNGDILNGKIKVVVNALSTYKYSIGFVVSQETRGMMIPRNTLIYKEIVAEGQQLKSGQNYEFPFSYQHHVTISDYSGLNRNTYIKVSGFIESPKKQIILRTDTGLYFQAGGQEKRYQVKTQDQTNVFHGNNLPFKIGCTLFLLPMLGFSIFAFFFSGKFTTPFAKIMAILFLVLPLLYIVWITWGGTISGKSYGVLKGLFFSIEPIDEKQFALTFTSKKGWEKIEKISVGYKVFEEFEDDRMSVTATFINNFYTSEQTFLNPENGPNRILLSYPEKNVPASTQYIVPERVHESRKSNPFTIKWILEIGITINNKMHSFKHEFKVQ